jgi:hypothetical protein
MRNKKLEIKNEKVAERPTTIVNDFLISNYSFLISHL